MSKSVNLHKSDINGEIPCHGLEESVTMSFSWTWSVGSMPFQSKSQKAILRYCQIDIWKDKRQAISNILKKSKVETLTLPNFKKYYKVTEIKTVQWWKKNRETENKIEPKTVPHKYSQLIFEKERQLSGDRISLQQMILEQMQKNESRHRPYTFRKNLVPNVSQT